MYNSHPWTWSSSRGTPAVARALCARGRAPCRHVQRGEREKSKNLSVYRTISVARGSFVRLARPSWDPEPHCRWDLACGGSCSLLQFRVPFVASFCA